MAGVRLQDRCIAMDFHGLMRRRWRTTYSKLQYRGGYALAPKLKDFLQPSPEALGDLAIVLLDA